MLRRVALVRTDVSEELLRSVRPLLLTVSVVPSSPILVTLIKEALNSSETSILITATRRNIQEDTILQEKSVYVQSKPNLLHVKTEKISMMQDSSQIMAVPRRQIRRKNFVLLYRRFRVTSLQKRHVPTTEPNSLIYMCAL
jgi:hypothetical protein